MIFARLQKYWSSFFEVDRLVFLEHRFVTNALFSTILSMEPIILSALENKGGKILKIIFE